MRKLLYSLGTVTALLIYLVFFGTTAFAQSGKIQGVVTDSETGEAMPGVNVQVVGTTKGATTNAEGFYQILNVQPGTHNLRASFVGYATKTIENVEVNVDLTTNVDIEMQEQTQELQEVTVRAQEEVVKKDISANVVNISQENMQNVPVASIESMVGLTAGVESGLSVRGSGADELAIRVDGASMRMGRNNQPFTGISFTGVQQIQVQTGGFNAEYGNVRSGMINVVTAEGPRNRYTVDVMTQYQPPQKRYFGPTPTNDPFYAYPFKNIFDRDANPEEWERNQTVMMKGVQAGCEEGPKNAPELNCVLNQWERNDLKQALDVWEGYEETLTELKQNDDDYNDWSVEHLMAAHDWYRRVPLDPAMPKYTLDGSFGGPVPVVSDYLGDLRFHVSYRQDNRPFVLPTFERMSNLDRTGRVKLTSDITTGMKVQIQGMLGQELGINSHWAGDFPMYSAENPPYPWVRSNSYMINEVDDGGRGGKDIWVGNWNESTPQENIHALIGGTFTHTVGQNTFYELRVQRMATDYLSGENVPRDTSIVRMLDGYELNEAPNGIGHRGNSLGFAGNLCRLHCAETRDSSRTSTWTAEFDITSQLSRYSQLKAGIDYHYQNLNIQRGRPNNYGPGDHYWEWRYYEEFQFEFNRSPQQGAAYIQDKLEFEGLVANIGLRADFFDPNTQWYEYEPYTRFFSGTYMRELDQHLEKQRTERQLTISPRLGVSFPITANSKLYYNYGHFRQMLDPSALYQIYYESNRGAPVGIAGIGNPNHPMPLTVAYELGFEQNIANQYLVRLTGYYKALENQPEQVNYENIDGTVDYTTPLPLNYEDIRGLELSIRKNVGQWVRGFANFSFMVHKSGDFGFDARYENEARMRQHINQSIGIQSRPVPQPYSRVNLELLTPVDFGPRLGFMRPLGDWHLSFLGRWRSGEVFTWAGGGTSGLAGVQDNVRWTDYWMLDTRLSKNISTPMGRLQVYVDVDNVLNLKYLYQEAIWSGNSPHAMENYMQSLHLPGDTFEELPSDPYGFVYGNDRPGDYPKAGKDRFWDHVPIVVLGTIEDTGKLREDPLYYEKENSRYMRASYDREAGEWNVKKADQEFVDRVLENKLYINMPGQVWNRYLNPRRFTLGLRFTF